jgi:hypothetical protein
MSLLRVGVEETGSSDYFSGHDMNVKFRLEFGLF